LAGEMGVPFAALVKTPDNEPVCAKMVSGTRKESKNKEIDFIFC